MKKRLLYIEQPPSDLSANHMCTDSGKLIEYLYGFLMIAEGILEKYAERNPNNKSE
jgi:hypothetical protein